MLEKTRWTRHAGRLRGSDKRTFHGYLPRVMNKKATGKVWETFNGVEILWLS